MKLIFCLEPFEVNRIDYSYAPEAEEAKKIGFTVEAIDFESLTREGNAPRAARFIKAAEKLEIGIYRGWMLKPEQYAKLYQHLITKNIQLINSAVEYKNCHYLSENYEFIKEQTPKTVFIDFDENFSLEKVYEKLSVFGDEPVILKDYVKSRKHEWNEACFIPNASDKEKVSQIVEKFLELQGEDLNKGLAFRKFVNFHALTNHSKSGMLLTKEFRLFFLNGKEIFSSEYWEEGDYNNSETPHEVFQDIALNIESNFFTMDIAQKENGDWLIIELGDAQVSGLPEKANAGKFYQNLYDNLHQ